MFCAYRSKRRDHIIRHAARVHESLVAEKVLEGVISGASDAFIDEGEGDNETSAPAGGACTGAGESILKPIVNKSNNNNNNNKNNTSGDGETVQQIIFDDDDSAEESDHDSDYDEDDI